MTSLLFLLATATLVVLSIRILIRLFRNKPIRGTLIAMGLLIVGYGLAWSLLKRAQKLLAVPLGTQVCFDDWCASVVKAERQAVGDSSLIILHIEMFNNARGIAQTPSEPRVHILDANGQALPFSVNRQQEYEKYNGAQPGIAHRLELHQSMETVLVFILPRTAKDLKAKIEEGPWITNLLFPEDEQVFLIPGNTLF
jgi:hypothetical protein